MHGSGCVRRTGADQPPFWGEFVTLMPEVVQWMRGTHQARQTATWRQPLPVQGSCPNGPLDRARRHRRRRPLHRPHNRKPSCSLSFHDPIRFAGLPVMPRSLHCRVQSATTLHMQVHSTQPFDKAISAHMDEIRSRQTSGGFFTLVSETSATRSRCASIPKISTKACAVKACTMFVG